MSVESKIYSPKPLLTAEELKACVRKWGLELRLLDGNDAIPESPITGTLDGDYLLIVWPAANAERTATIDAAIARRDKTPIDELAKDENISWCSLYGRHFNYAEHWSEIPEEVDAYEASMPADKLQRVKSAITRYWLRSGTWPVGCAQLVDGLTRVLVKETSGLKSD